MVLAASVGDCEWLLMDAAGCMASDWWFEFMTEVAGCTWSVLLLPSTKAGTSGYSSTDLGKWLMISMVADSSQRLLQD